MSTTFITLPEQPLDIQSAEFVLDLYTRTKDDSTFDRNSMALLVLQVFGLKPEEFLWKETKKRTHSYALEAVGNLPAGWRAHASQIHQLYNEVPRPWCGLANEEQHPQYQSEADILMQTAKRVMATSVVSTKHTNAGEAIINAVIRELFSAK